MAVTRIRPFAPACLRRPVIISHWVKARGGYVDQTAVTALARDSKADAPAFRKQYPAYAADIAGKTRKALDALRADSTHHCRCNSEMPMTLEGVRLLGPDGVKPQWSMVTELLVAIAA
jgi:hypothetical protein